MTMKRDAQGRFLPKNAPKGWTDKGGTVAQAPVAQVQNTIQGLPVKAIVEIGQKVISLLGVGMIQRAEMALIQKYQNEPIFISNMEKLLPIYMKLGMNDAAKVVVDKLTA